MAKKKEALTREDVLDQAIDEIRSSSATEPSCAWGTRARAVRRRSPRASCPWMWPWASGDSPGPGGGDLRSRGNWKDHHRPPRHRGGPEGGGIAAFIDAEHAWTPEAGRRRGGGHRRPVPVPARQRGTGPLHPGHPGPQRRGGPHRGGLRGGPHPSGGDRRQSGGVHSGGPPGRLRHLRLRRLTAAISKSRTTVVFINQLRAQISTGYSQRAPRRPPPAGGPSSSTAPCGSR